MKRWLPLRVVFFIEDLQRWPRQIVCFARGHIPSEPMRCVWISNTTTWNAALGVFCDERQSGWHVFTSCARCRTVLESRTDVESVRVELRDPPSVLWSVQSDPETW